ncbi:hypothetical protein [Methylobacter luteus]|uniref:hypothetical protein n=1 Tax=Methylobacter luteus TaxID=415 RepID=UPI0006876BEB|nr:hypothetical protein [Methylobacter luteus]
MAIDQEFADEYTKQEKIQLGILYFAIGAFIYITHEKWVFPWIRWYASTAYCHSVFGYSGVLALWAGLFVGLPIFFGLLIGACTVWPGIKTLKQGQYPPKGSKVFKPTKILRGKAATFRGLRLLLAPCLFVAIAIWGAFQVPRMPKENSMKLDYSVCKASQASTWTSIAEQWTPVNSALGTKEK